MKKYLTILFGITVFLFISGLLYGAAQKEAYQEEILYPDIDVSVEETEVMSPVVIQESKEQRIVSFGDTFRLEIGESVELPDGTILSIERVINEPCTEVCVWSGQGIWYKWVNLDGDENITPPNDSVVYTLETIETDYSSYADVQVEPLYDIDPGVVSQKRYLGDSLEKCSTIRFFCYEGEEPFENEEGCGCQVVDSS